MEPVRWMEAVRVIRGPLLELDEVRMKVLSAAGTAMANLLLPWRWVVMDLFCAWRLCCDTAHRRLASFPLGWCRGEASARQQERSHRTFPGPHQILVSAHSRHRVVVRDIIPVSYTGPPVSHPETMFILR